MMTDKQRSLAPELSPAFHSSVVGLQHAGWQPAPRLHFHAVFAPDSGTPLAEHLLGAEHVQAATEIWCTELASIGESVPVFAIWQIATLERCFYRYCNILQVAGRDVRFRRSCMTLMANAERISQTLDAARETRQWPAFNRAAFELRQDCEQLASLVAAMG